MADPKTADLMARLIDAGKLLTDAASVVARANAERDLAQSNYEGQKRNTVAFMAERDALQIEVERLRAALQELADASPSGMERCDDPCWVIDFAKDTLNGH